MRRSSRFIHSTSTNSAEDPEIIGTVYQEIDVQVKTRRVEEMEQKSDLSPDRNDKFKNRRHSNASKVLVSVENIS